MSSTAAATSPFPLSTERAGRLKQALDGLDGDALLWVSGYVAGLAQAQRGALATSDPAVEASAPQRRLTVIYGSQTGNARRLAEALASRAEAAGLAVRLFRADAYPLRELKDERLLYLVVSTQGDGDPPEDSHGLVEFLAGRRAPSLKPLSFAVLGLGDSSYPKFCEVARRLDARLAELGGTRLFPLGEADVDIDPVAGPWLDRALTEASRSLRREPIAATVTPLRRATAPAGHSRDLPFAAEVLVNQRITGRDSDRDVRHIELSLDGSGLGYRPGDALGVWPENAPELVARILAATGLDGETDVVVAGEQLSLTEALRVRREITRVARPLVIEHARRHAGDGPGELAGNGEALRAWLTGHQVLDLLLQWPAAWTAQDLVDALPALTPRLYSIASSPAEAGTDAHLTVALARTGVDADLRIGAASGFLASRSEAASARVFVESNDRFRLPTDGNRDILMIGPGTGVAPFRSFVQQRSADGASGRNWLLFGARRFRDDFLYQLEWQRALKRGTLHRIDLAFSRDRSERVYVQQRLVERGRDVFDWLEGGAHLYVCGAIAMGKDVHRSLVEIIARHGGRDLDDAEAYLRDLQAQGRYARDVY